MGVIWEISFMFRELAAWGGSLIYKPMLEISERGLESQVGIEGLGRTKN